MSGLVEGRTLNAPLELSADVVVVGSGAGGMVAATLLAEAGLEVVVVEEGKYVSNRQQGRFRQSESVRHLWRDGSMSVAFGLGGGAPSVNLMVGTGVGGSSLLTGGVCLRVPEAILAPWASELGLTELTPKGLDPHYREVEEAIHVEEVPVSMRSRSTELFGIGAKKLGHPIKPISRNTKGCHGCGRCNFGCPEGAKMSVDVAYLPRLLAAGGQVFSDCLVERVVHERGRASGVRGRLLNRPGRKRGEPFTVHAKVVMLACGGLHTPILLKSSGLAPFGSQVGENLTLHPGFRVFARFDEDVRGWRGALQSAYTDAFERDHVTLMSLFVPAPVIAATMPGVGPAHYERAKHAPNIAIFGGMVHDEGPGRVRRGLGREPFVTYSMTDKDRRAMYKGIRITAETFFAAGAREVYLPILGSDALDADAFARFELERVPPVRFESASQHPLGSCQMGTTAADSAVDPDGKLWDTHNVFLCDGSVIPTSLGVNPQLTIMAMATRIAHELRDGFRRRFH
ncbi:MAG: GMC family oxidoreductase N-terminal domain-containing protein [Sandaracinaceae bacterium]